MIRYDMRRIPAPTTLAAPSKIRVGGVHRGRSLFPVLLLILALALGIASVARAASCRDEVGAAKADRYVRQCLVVSPATHPPCNAENSCSLIRDEIARGCRLLGGDAAMPEFCRPYLRPAPKQP
jgi:hypothetical protein